MKYKYLILKPNLPERRYTYVKETANVILKKNFEISILKVPTASYSETSATQPNSAERRNFETNITNQCITVKA
jgi:hypothetical protein